LKPPCKIAGLISRLALGIIFIIAAGSKGTDIVRFVREIEILTIGIGFKDFNALMVISTSLALVIVGIELVLGSMLLVNYRTRLAGSVTLGLLGCFCFLSVYAMITGSMDSCGCFGMLVKRTPAVSLIENVVLVMLAFITIITYTSIKQPVIQFQKCLSRVGADLLSSITMGLDKSAPTLNSRKYSASIIILIGIVWTITFFIFPPSWAAVRTGVRWHNPQAEPSLPQSSDLLVWVMDPECTNCMEMIPTLNRITENKVTTLAAITDATPGRIAEFKWDFEPVFSLHRVDPEHIKRIGLPTGSLISIRQGKVVRVWREEESLDIDFIHSGLNR